jgi:hypothetical protein
MGTSASLTQTPSCAQRPVIAGCAVCSGRCTSSQEHRVDGTIAAIDPNDSSLAYPRPEVDPILAMTCSWNITATVSTLAFPSGKRLTWKASHVLQVANAGKGRGSKDEGAHDSRARPRYRLPFSATSVDSITVTGRLYVLVRFARREEDARDTPPSWRCMCAVVAAMAERTCRRVIKLVV